MALGTEVWKRGTKMATVVIDLEAPIVPGLGAAGITLGQVPENLPHPISTTHLKDSDLLEYPSVTIWVKDGVVCQIGVRAGYRGKLDGVLSIGSTIADVIELLGDVTEDDCDNLVVTGRPGWCFETAEWRNGHTVELNLEARITEIFVHP